MEYQEKESKKKLTIREIKKQELIDMMGNVWSIGEAEAAGFLNIKCDKCGFETNRIIKSRHHKCIKKILK